MPFFHDHPESRHRRDDETHDPRSKRSRGRSRMIHELFRQLVFDLRQTGWPEFTAVVAGILSVWYSRKENILVYPTGLINTIIYIYISFKSSLLGEASVNFYYTALNIYGWVLWTRKDRQEQYVVQVRNSTGVQRLQQLGFFTFFYVAVFFSLT